VATTISNFENQSSATLSNNKGKHTKSYKVGEQILPLVSIINIQPKHIIIDNKGVTERLTIQVSKGQQQVEDSSYLISVNDTRTEDPSLQKEEDEILIDEPKHRILPASGEMTLSRDWLNQQLLDQSELAKYFYNAEHVVEGLHLIKLNNIDDQRFYTTLGLKSGDVIMRVNDQWVHEAQNPLWASLQQNDPVSLVVMRKGLPYRYDYRIE
jgi:type II secretory pathway component PulC